MFPLKGLKKLTQTLSKVGLLDWYLKSPIVMSWIIVKEPLNSHAIETRMVTDLK